LKQATDQTAPLVDLLPRNTLLVLDEPEKLAAAAENYARQIPKDDKFFAEWRHTLESVLTIVQLTEAMAIDPPAAYINLRLASLDAFRPLDTRSPEPEIAEQMRRSFFEQMQRWTAEGYSLQVFCSNDGEKQRFEELWREYTEASNTAASKLEASIATLSRGFLWTEAKLARDCRNPRDIQNKEVSE